MVRLWLVDNTGVSALTQPMETQAVEFRKQFSPPGVDTDLCSTELLVECIESAEGREVLDTYFPWRQSNLNEILPWFPEDQCLVAEQFVFALFN